MHPSQRPVRGDLGGSCRKVSIDALEVLPALLAEHRFAGKRMQNRPERFLGETLVEKRQVIGGEPDRLEILVAVSSRQFLVKRIVRRTGDPDVILDVILE